MVSQQRLEVECARLQERYDENPAGRVFAPLADVLRKLGRTDEALRICRTGLGRHPSYSSAHVILGKIHLERGDTDEAFEAFREVLALDDENLLALRHLARLHEEAGDLEDALEMWRRVSRIEPDSDAVEETVERLERRLAGDEEPIPAEPSDETSAEETAEAPAPAEEGEDAQELDEAEPPYSEESGEEEPVGETTADEEPVGETTAEEEPAEEMQESSPGKASSAEIATITLAQIYYEQGFLAKALEVYEQIHARNPGLDGLAERVASIREELEAQSAPRPESPAEGDLDDLAPDREEPIARQTSSRRGAVGSDDGEGDSEVSVEIEHEEPMTRRMEASSEKERFENFRRWLDGISADDADRSQ